MNAHQRRIVLRRRTRRRTEFGRRIRGYIAVIASLTEAPPRFAGPVMERQLQRDVFGRPVSLAVTTALAVRLR